jgi:hypothetical protein
MWWCDSTNIEKIVRWRSLRGELAGMDFKQVAEEVAKFWARVPYSAAQISIYTPSEWPGPWEILSKNSICCNMISLMIYHTIKLARPDMAVEIKVVFENGHDFLVVMAEGYILNYQMGFIIHQDELKLTFTHSYTDI